MHKIFLFILLGGFSLSLTPTWAQDVRFRHDYLILYRETVQTLKDHNIDVGPGIYLFNAKKLINRHDLENLSDGVLWKHVPTGLQILVGRSSGEIPETRDEIWAKFNGKYFLLKDQQGKTQALNEGIPLDIIPAVEGMFLLTKTKKVLYRPHNLNRYVSVPNKGLPKKLYQVDPKYYALTRSGMTIVFLSEDLEVVVQDHLGQAKVLAMATLNEQQEPQLSLSGDGVFLPEGADGVKYIQLDARGEVEIENIIFRARSSEKIVFANNEVKVIQNKAEGGRAQFYLTSNGQLISAKNSASTNGRLTSEEIQSWRQYAESWSDRARMGLFDDLLPLNDQYQIILRYLEGQNRTWANIVAPLGGGKTTSLKGLTNYLKQRSGRNDFWNEYEAFNISLGKIKQLKDEAEKKVVAGEVVSGQDAFSSFKQSWKGKKVLILIDDFLDDPSLGATNAPASFDLFMSIFRQDIEEGKVRIVTTTEVKLWQQLVTKLPQAENMGLIHTLRPITPEEIEKILQLKMNEAARQFKIAFEPGTDRVILLTAKNIFSRPPTVAEISQLVEKLARANSDANGRLIVINKQTARRLLIEERFHYSILESKIDLPRIRQILDQELVGQRAAKDKILRDLSSLKVVPSYQGPLLTLFFIGPTGVGKTYTAELLSQATSLPLVKIDMNFFENNASNRGFAKGTKNRELVERYKNEPFILLLDEVDKRNDGFSTKERINQLRGLIHTGIYGEGTDDELDLRNTILIFTANYAQKIILDAGNAPAPDLIKQVEAYVLDTKDTPENEQIAPHVWSHIHESLVIFRPLSVQELESVTKLFIKKLGEELKARDNIDLIVSNKFNESLVAISFSNHLGVMPIKQKIEKTLKREIALYLEKKAGTAGNVLYVTVAPNGSTIIVDSSNPDFKKFIDEDSKK